MDKHLDDNELDRMLAALPIKIPPVPSLCLPPRPARRWPMAWALAMAASVSGMAAVVTASRATQLVDVTLRVTALWIAHPLLERLGLAAAASVVGFAVTQYMSGSLPPSPARQGRPR